MKAKAFLAAAFFAGLHSGVALAEAAPTNDPQSTQQCNVKTKNVQVCGGGGSGGIGISGEPPRIGHFLEYPIGQSDSSVAKQIGDSVHHFFSHL